VYGEDIIDFGIPSSNIQFVSFSDLETLLSNANQSVTTVTGVMTLCYFKDGYLVTENPAGISNIIQLIGVTTFTALDFVLPSTISA
jgi:hypothetical protein